MTLINEAKSVGKVIEGVPIAPVVICGICFNPMDIEEWWNGVPHPNRGHECSCGKYWMPMGGNNPLAMNNKDEHEIDFGWVLFFHACGDLLHD